MSYFSVVMIVVVTVRQGKTRCSTRSHGALYDTNTIILSLKFSVASSCPNEPSYTVVVLELHPRVGMVVAGRSLLRTAVPVSHVLGLARHQAGAGTAGLVLALLAVEVTDGVLAVDLHVFPERGRMGVGLVAAAHLAVVRFVAGVHMRVLLSITGVGKPSVAAVELTFEWFLT